MDDDNTLYQITRRYFRNNDREIIATDLTLQEAQEHCNDPETSSRTCTEKEGVERTLAFGPWFDGYDSM